MASPSPSSSASDAAPGRAGAAVLTAWLVTAVYYFYQYAMRSAPAQILFR